MTDATDDLLARMRAETAAWFRAPVLSGERESAGGRLAAAVLKLDELLSNGAPWPSGWVQQAAAEDLTERRRQFRASFLADAIPALPSLSSVPELVQSA